MAWSRPGDGDIYATTPSNMSIYWDNKGPSNETDLGELDLDDEDTGPGNVFWSNTPPTGTYHLCFNQYDFDTPSSVFNPITVTFKVRKLNAGTQTFTKTFTDGDSDSGTCSPTLSEYVVSVDYP